jgi:SAM-dependent methyltransferase
MATFAPATAAAMAASYDFSQFGSVMDVGGGNGAILIGLLGANPKLRGIVFDRAGAAQRARTKLSEAGLTARCEAVAGDFFAAVPEGADAYLLKHVIHDWDDAKATAILVNCRRAMKPGARLLIAEGVYPPQIDQSLESRGAAANDVNMLVVIIFFVTSADSGTLVLGRLLAFGRRPPTQQRIIWGSVLGIVTLILLLLGGDQAMKSLQAASIAGALPFTFVLLAMMVGLIKSLREDGESIVDNEAHIKRMIEREIADLS